ncbi:hypothetical protein KVR01_004900 [Diaporthe batatas]|uniref:uncharacterized protein n=1 Tax=Diaporthe batatas TaxID=748121 RepID=UPI001D04300C|nr:uncharacterized protein KVR01_004900 [Diaporthe batatas]KAG8164625.1 hypothetical protein KVR01_004900 [Diaporthe batatas]
MTLYPPSTVIPIYAVLTGFGILLTCLRFWARMRHTSRTSSTSSRVGADDILIVAGVLVTAACAAIQFYNAVDGTGGEAISSADADARALVAHRINYAMIVIEKGAFGAIKLSLLLSYRRIFGVCRGFRRLNNSLLALIALWTLAFVLADLLICGRDVTVQLALDQTRALHACGDKGVLLIAFAASSILTDALVLGVPLLYVRQLQMAANKKLAAAFVFFLGTVYSF